MDHPQTRLEALAQRTDTDDRQFCRWRRLACGRGVLGLIGWTLQTVTAGDGRSLSIPDCFAALERKLTPSAKPTIPLAPSTQCVVELTEPLPLPRASHN